MTTRQMRREKEFLLEILEPVTETLNAKMPSFVTEIEADPADLSDHEIEELCQYNFSVYNEWPDDKRVALARWWASFWDELCEIIGGETSDSEMLQHISEEGFQLV